jgi:dihydropteroate synthase
LDFLNFLKIDNKNKFPKIMGILNVTPDSFSDGGKYFEKEKAIEHALEMAQDGADIIDIGGESTRPGAENISVFDELKRVIPVIKGIKKQLPDIKISIDTTKLLVANAAVDEGAEIINDISGLNFEPSLALLAAEMDISLILMHIQGTPGIMQKKPKYKDVFQDVYNKLEKKIDIANSYGVNSIIADVGIGFGKTLEHNLELLKNHIKFKSLGVPLLLGISRKSFIDKILNIEHPEDRDIPTALLHALLLNSGADIIRVHNVKLISMLKKLTQALS